MRRLLVALVLTGLFGLMPAQPASAADTYGAIAYSQMTDRYGYSYGYGTSQDATKAALGFCGADDCRLGTWFHNAYGALATGSNRAWGANWGTSEGTARYNALQKCRSFGGTNCTVRVVAHSSRGKVA